MRKKGEKLASNLLDILWCKIRRFCLKGKIIRCLSESDNSEVLPIIEYLKRPFLKDLIIPYNYIEEYKIENIDLNWDAEGKWFYINLGFINMYLKYKKEKQAKKCYNAILIEQDFRSPHCYISDTFQPEEGSVILDLGGAEGYFPIKFLERVKKVYIFECDKEWIDALNKTYENYKDKVIIVDKFVDSYSDSTHISLDDFVQQNMLSNEKLFIKIDVEGSELDVIKGAQTLLSMEQSIRWAICAYHFESHEELIRKSFKGWNVTAVPGYILNFYDYNFKPPYIRKGVLQIDNMH